MATTISPRVVLTDDTGTFAAPNNDGTVINNALFQTLQDRIDALFSSPLSVGGIIVESFGAHPVYVASGSGANTLEVRNLSAGSSNTAGYLLGNDIASGRGQLVVTASDFVSVAPVIPADAVALQSFGAGGLFLRSTGATSGIQVQSLLPIDFLVNNLFTVSIQGNNTGRGLVVQGTPSTGADVTGVYLAPNCTGATSIAAGLEVNPTLSGQYLYGTILRAPVVVGANLHAATLTIVGPPSGGTGGQAYALEIGAGRVLCQGQFTSGNGTAAAPMYSFAAAPTSGLFWDPAVGPSGALGIAVGGVAPVLLAGRFAGETYVYLGTSVATAGADHTDFIIATADTMILGTAAETATQTLTLHPLEIDLPGIPVLSGANYLHVLGPNNSIVKTSSSARYKTAIRDLADDDPLRVLQLRPRLYQDAATRPGTPPRDFAGLIAEEVADVLPLLVALNDAGTPETVMYDRLPVYLLRAVRQLAGRVDALEGGRA